MGLFARRKALVFGVGTLILVDRDILVLQELARWRFLLGRHIAVFCRFSSIRTADRRLKILVEAKYLERKKILYGLPYIYTLAHKGRLFIGANKRAENIRLDTLRHDIIVRDCIPYFVNKYGLRYSDIITEKELHLLDGFGTRKHYPDFVFTKDKETYAVEIEISNKSKERIEENIRINYLNYDYQIWIVESDNRIKRILDENTLKVENMSILYIEAIINA